MVDTEMYAEKESVAAGLSFWEKNGLETTDFLA